MLSGYHRTIGVMGREAAIWEIGEILAICLWPVTFWMPPWLQCRCEVRRLYLNRLGEKLWAWWDFQSYNATRRRFERVVLFWASQKPVGASVLYEVIRMARIRISRRTMERWLDELPLASFVQSGERVYGLRG